MKRPNCPYLILSREHCSPALAHGLFSSTLSRLQEPELGLELRAPPWAPQLPAPPQVCGAVTAPCAAPTPPQAAQLRALPISLRRPRPPSSLRRPRPPSSLRCPCCRSLRSPCCLSSLGVQKGLGDSDTAIQAWEAATQAWEGAWEQSWGPYPFQGTLLPGPCSRALLLLLSCLASMNPS